MAYKFGKKPAKRLRKSLCLSNYLSMSAVSYPAVRAYERPIAYGMLANDTLGCCVIAGHYHLRMNWHAVATAGSPLVVTDQEVISDYSAITGYDPSSPSTDQGTDMPTALAWYKDDYCTLDIQNVEQVKAGMFLFGGAIIGFNVPQSMVDQLNAGVDPDWSYSPNDKPSGEGHCVVPLGYGRDGVALISWGKIYHTSWDFFLAWTDEAYCIVSPEWIKASGVSPSGLDLNGLLADASHL
jgi:hypothetical protein